MVTTRRQSQGQSQTGSQTPQKAAPEDRPSTSSPSTTPSQSRKHRRGQDDTKIDADEPSELQNAAADDQVMKTSHIEGDGEEKEESSARKKNKKQKILPLRRKSGTNPLDEVKEHEKRENRTVEKHEHQHAEYSIPISQLGHGELEGEAKVEEEAEAKVEEEAEADEAEDTSIEPVRSLPSSAPTPAPVPVKHHKFTDDDESALPAVTTSRSSTLVTTEAQEIHDSDAGSDSDDSDEAPETILNPLAQTQILASARKTAKAIEETVQDLKLKRKVRDERLKEQLQRQQAKKVADAAVDENEEGSQDGNMKKGKAMNIPAQLPLEYLTDSESESESDPGSGSDSDLDLDSDIDSDDAFTSNDVLPPSKKLKLFPSHQPPQLQDLANSNTTYRILTPPANKSLAPIASNNARAVKEAWLSGQRGGVKMHRKGHGKGGKPAASSMIVRRKVPNQGFFVNKSKKRGMSQSKMGGGGGAGGMVVNGRRRM